jgi:hypothetical protein
MSERITRLHLINMLSIITREHHEGVLKIAEGSPDARAILAARRAVIESANQEIIDAGDGVRDAKSI